MVRQEVYVHPSTTWLKRPVLEVLEYITPVRFKDCPSFSDCQEKDVILSLSGDDQVLDEISAWPLRCFHVSRNGAARHGATKDTVRFADTQELERPLRGRCLSHRPGSFLSAITPKDGDRMLAKYGETPVWVVRPGVGQIVSAPLPDLQQNEKPFDYLNGGHFIQLLPLVHFLREVSAGLGWQTPPLRACYILDDPNLRWPSYGYVSFEKLVHEAREAGFHVAFATVPLDTWSSLPRAVSLFKNNTAQVSLLIHGNDHTRHELGQSRSHDRFLGLFAQALLRIERFERVTGLTVERVMVPPHEALADAAVVPMLSLGIEGVSLTLWSLRDWNPQREWASTYGMGLAEITDEGFPALARHDLNEASEGPIVISAFLRNPIVLCGHHTTVASGLDILTRTASIVNSVGNVQWSSAGAILRSNYLHRRDDSTLWVKPYSCCIDVPIPDGVRTLAVAGREDIDRAFTVGGNWTCQTLTSERAQIGTASAFTVAAGDRVRLRSSALGTVDYHQVEMPRTSAWALSRRALCEIRDRLVVLKP